MPGTGDGGDDEDDDDDDDDGAGGSDGGDSDDDDDDDAVDEGDFDTGMPPTDGAILEISDAPMFEFAVTGPGQTTTHLFEIQNIGSTPATDIEPDAMDPAFAFIGGFPGDGGTCGSELQPGADCLIEVAYSPVKWGPDVSQLVINYGNAAEETQAFTALAGKCGGITDNLLKNPTFDASFEGWSTSQGSWSRNWSTAQLSYVALAGGSGTHVLRQNLSLDPWSDAIATGNVTIIVSGEHWAESEGNDPHGFVVATFTDGGAETTAYESVMAGWGWHSHSGTGSLPSDAADLAYALVCQTTGNDCDGAFDDVSLQLQWP